jgi:hypothetical protein
MLELFHQRYGYQLLPNLTALVRRGEKDRKVCYDYMKLVSDRFAESYFGLLGKWCEEHNVIATGHIGEHPNQGDFYSQVGPMQIPGIDNLGGTNKLKGPELLLPKMVSSLAHMNGNSRSMCEVYGVTPWNFTIADKIENLKKNKIGKGTATQIELFKEDSRKLRSLYSWALMTWEPDNAYLFQLGFAVKSSHKKNQIEDENED